MLGDWAVLVCFLAFVVLLLRRIGAGKRVHGPVGGWCLPAFRGGYAQIVPDLFERRVGNACLMAPEGGRRASVQI